MQRVVVEVRFERLDLPDGRGRLLAHHAARPLDVLGERGVAGADVVVDEESRPDVVVADERVGAVLPSYAHDRARGLDRHQHGRDRFERVRVLGERAVVRDDRHVQPEFQSQRPRVAEAPPRDER